MTMVQLSITHTKFLRRITTSKSIFLQSCPKSVVCYKSHSPNQTPFKNKYETIYTKFHVLHIQGHKVYVPKPIHLCTMLFYNTRCQFFQHLTKLYKHPIPPHLSPFLVTLVQIKSVPNIKLKLWEYALTSNHLPLIFYEFFTKQQNQGSICT